MFSPSIASSTESSAEIRFLYSANSSAGRRTNQRMVENVGTGGSKLNRSVTFAKPLVSDVREIDPLDSTSSPILAGHPNMYPNLNGGGPAVCRICYSSENSGPKTGEPLISPCNCKGTMGLYHRTCLNKWLAVSNKNCCEICLFKFQIKRVKRSFWEYIRDEDSRAARRSLITDLLCFFLLTPLVLISSIICCISSIQLINEEKENRQNDENGGMRFEIAIGLLFLSAILLIAYAIWIAVTITFHRKAFHSWQSTHWTRTIVDQLSLEESILVNGSSSASADDSRVRV